MSNLTYLYAIVPRADAMLDHNAAVPGVDDQPITALEQGALMAFVSSVSSAEWSSEALDTNVRDMEWLAPRATRHQEVLAAIHAAAGAVLPLPFATLYRDPAAINALLQTRQAEFGEALQRLEGAEEWTLKVFQDRARFEEQLENISPSFAQALAELQTAPPGRAYLLRKQLDGLRRDEAARATKRVSDELEAAVTATVLQVVREPIAGRRANETSVKPGGDEARLTLRLALLIDRQRRDEVDAALSAILAPFMPLGYHVELTGPWPPYSFSRLMSEADA